MSLQEKIRNIIFLFVKNEYNTYLQNNNIKFINDNEINNVISSFYIDKKKRIKIIYKILFKRNDGRKLSWSTCRKYYF